MDREETPDAEPSGGEPEPSEEELRARIEENLRKVRVQDVLLESVVTIINLTARRIAKPDERDLEQARVGIDAIRAVADLLEEEPREQVRNALSELQMLYAREAQGGPPAGGEGGAGEGGAPEAEEPASKPRPATGSEPPPGGLWTPPGA